MPELLAPAGDWDCLRAAVANGADAVYFGVRRFSARARATNFAVEELAEVATFLHDRNVKGYLALNTLVFGGELPGALDTAAAGADCGIDAVIVQDLGLAAALHAMAPALPLHASTQMTLTEPAAMERVRELGITRVILPRELTLDEIAAVAAATTLELEVFVHGALCISVSGQCLASLAMGGRSANRGQCAQPCRLPYELGGRPPYPLSPMDLSARGHLPRLVDAGVRGLKIEGRMKGPSYVAAVVRMYRRELDRLSGAAAGAAPADEQAAAQSFSRGFTTGFLGGVDHRSLVDGRRPGALGTRVGSVSAVAGDRVRARLAGGASIAPGDGVLLVGDARQCGGRVMTVRQTGGDVELTLRKSDSGVEQPRAGWEVWKTDDPRMERELARTHARVEAVRRTPLHVRLAASPGQPAKLEARDGAASVTVQSQQPLAAADRSPLDLAMVRRQLDRLGDTPYELGDVELVGPQGPLERAAVVLPVSVLNNLRRRAVAELLQRRRDASRHEVSCADALDRLRAQPQPRVDPPAQPLLHVLVRDPAQAAAAMDWRAACGVGGWTIADAASFGESREVMSEIALRGGQAAFATPRLWLPGEAPCDELLGCSPSGALVRNLGLLSRLRGLAPGLPLCADFALNAVNDIAIGVLRRWGASRVTIALDAGPDELADALAHRQPGELEAVLRLHVPLFHTRHCLWAAGTGKRAHPECGATCSRPLALRDRKDVALPARRDAACRNTIYAPAGSPPRGASAERLRELGMVHFRVELLDEPPAAVAETLSAVFG